MFWVHEMALTGGEEMTHLLLDIPEYPTWGVIISSSSIKRWENDRTTKEVHEDDMRGIPSLLRRSDVAEREPVQPGLAVRRAYGMEGEEEGPGDEPGGEEDDDHETEEADEDVGVDPVCAFDVLWIQLEEGDGPEYGLAERLHAFAVGVLGTCMGVMGGEGRTVHLGRRCGVRRWL